jgi:hypothetical protein
MEKRTVVAAAASPVALDPSTGADCGSAPVPPPEELELPFFAGSEFNPDPIVQALMGADISMTAATINLFPNTISQA